MKVFFDARMITHPGIGRYIKCLLPQLLKHKDIDLHVLGNKDKLLASIGLKEKIIDFNYPIYSLQEQFGYFRLRRTIKKDILHVPHYNVPYAGGFNLVATIHDLIHIQYPQGASNSLAPHYMKHMLNKCARNASRIICVSAATEKLLREVTGINERTAVIYEGADEQFRQGTDSAFLKQVTKTYSLPDKFILYVGSIRRHKNILSLLDVFTQLRKENKEISLILVGRLSQDINLKHEGVFHLGNVASDTDLAGIYRLASVFCNLSLYEGFGLTILEAQASMLPVVASNIPVHLEIGGEGILPVEPHNQEQIILTLKEALNNASLRQSLKVAGLDNLKRFNWQKTAEETIRIYKTLI